MNILQGLLQDIESGLHLGSLSSIFDSLTSVLSIYEQNYLQDKSARNAAIDTIVAMLQKLKSAS